MLATQLMIEFLSMPVSRLSGIWFTRRTLNENSIVPSFNVYGLSLYRRRKLSDMVNTIPAF